MSAADNFTPFCQQITNSYIVCKSGDILGPRNKGAHKYLVFVNGSLSIAQFDFLIEVKPLIHLLIVYLQPSTLLRGRWKYVWTEEH